MKEVICGQWALFAIALMLATGDAAGAFEIVRGGKAVAAIVIDDAAPPSAAKAASELSAYVERMTGAELQTVKMPKDNLATIRIGGPCQATRPDEIFVAKNSRGELVISGFGPRAPIYAVYRFLESQGVRFWSPWRETVPQMQDLKLQENFKIQYAPPFRYRSGWSCSDSGDGKHYYAWRFKVGHNSLDSPEFGGAVKWEFGEAMCHKKRWMWPLGVAPQDDLAKGGSGKTRFEAHPDWYALVNGKRQPTQICASSKGGLDALEVELHAWLEANPGAPSVSLVSDDNADFCQCLGCRKIRERMKGGNMALEVHVANEMARRLCKDYPDVIFNILAYWTKQDPPAAATLHKNVGVCLAITHEQSQPVTKCKTWLGKASKWEKLAPGRISIWDYYAGFNNFNEPRADFINIAESMRYYRQRGYMGVSAQLAQGRTANFGQMKAYVWAQFCWNPDREINSMIDEYIRGNYGSGATFVKQYWEQNLRLMRTCTNVRMGMYGMNYNEWYRAPEMVKAWELIHKALDATKGEPEAHEECEILYVSILSDFLLRWKSQNVAKELKRHPALNPVPEPKAMLVEVEEIVKRIKVYYWSEKMNWENRLATWHEEYD